MMRVFITLSLFALFAGSAWADEVSNLKSYAKSVGGKFTLPTEDSDYCELILPETLTDEQLAALTKLAPQKLSTLNLSFCAKVTDAGFKVVKDMPGLHMLMVPGQLGDAAWEGVSERLPGIIRIEMVCADRPFSPMTPASLKSMAELSKLSELCLGSTAFDDTCWERLAKFPRLELLVIHSEKIRGIGIKHLANLKTLRILNLSCCPLSQAGVREVGGLKFLNDLSLWKCGVTDTGMATWNELGEVHNLDLADNPVTDNVFPCLAGLKKLESVALRGTKVTDAGITEFTKTLPKVNVLKY